MALLFSAVQMAELRRRFLSSLTKTELARLAADLAEAAAAAAEADSKAQAAQSTADAAATPGDLAAYATVLALEAAVSGLASEAYVDGKFGGTYDSDDSDESKVLIDGVYHPVVNGLIMAVPEAPP